MGKQKIFIYERGMEQSAIESYVGNMVQDCGVLTELTPDRLLAVICTDTAVMALAYTSMLLIQ